MKTEQYLGQVIRFESMTRNKVAEIRRCKDMATSITVANKEDKIQTSSDKDKLGSMVAKIVDLENEVALMEKTRDTIIQQIEGMDDFDFYTILYSKFIYDKNLADIRREVHCSKTHIYRLYSEALMVFEEKYGETYLKREKWN